MHSIFSFVMTEIRNLSHVRNRTKPILSTQQYYNHSMYTISQLQSCISITEAYTINKHHTKHIIRIAARRAEHHTLPKHRGNVGQGSRTLYQSTISHIKQSTATRAARGAEQSNISTLPCWKGGRSTLVAASSSLRGGAVTGGARAAMSSRAAVDGVKAE
jgi:hypothetical protein